MVASAKSPLSDCISILISFALPVVAIPVWVMAILGAMTSATTDINFKRMFNEGPEVSLKGSPTVSPTTAALWASVPLRPSDSIIFLALSHACLLYTSDAADDLLCVDLGGRRIIKKKNINCLIY